MTIDKRKKSIQQSQAEMKDKFEKMGLRVVTEDDIRASGGKLNQKSGDVYLRDEEKYATGHTTAPHLHANFTSNAAADKFNRGLGGGTGGTGVATGGMARRGNKMEKANNTHAYDNEMANAYNRKGFDPETQRILKAQIWQESGIDGNTKKSRPGAAGIAQFMPETARRFGVDVHSTASSFKGQADYMDFLLKRYNGNMKNALMAYNMGEGNMDAYLKTGKITRGRPLPKETENYANDILANKNSFSLGGQAIPQSKLQATATSKKGMSIASVPAPTKPKIPKPPVVKEKISSDDDDDNKKSSWLSNMAIGGYITQNVSDRGIAHAVTGGLGEDRWWG